MFLVVLAQPRDDRNFNGLIGIYPFMTPHTLLSGPRKGQVEWRSQNVDGKAYINIMLNHVLPDIKRKMQRMQGQLLFIQQDGAKALKNEDLWAVLKSHNWKMQLVTQPPRSPFLNICDLSFNWSLQCKAESIKYHCDSLEDMKNLVESEFNSYDVGLLKS